MNPEKSASATVEVVSEGKTQNPPVIRHERGRKWTKEGDKWVHEGLQVDQMKLGTSAKLAEAINEAFPPEVICASIKTLLESQTTDRGGNTRPDVKGIDRGLYYVFAYGHGLPVQRSESISVEVDGTEVMQSRIADSPEMRRAALLALGVPLEVAEKLAGAGKLEPAAVAGSLTKGLAPVPREDVPIQPLPQTNDKETFGVDAAALDG